MHPLKYAKGRYVQWCANRARGKLLARDAITSVDPEDFGASLRDPNAYYQRAFQDFHRVLPSELRAHRAYFQAERRGFGEDGFHTMWWRLIRRYRPARFLEIGVYRGQTISLVALIAKLEGLACEVTGISPFTSAGDSVSKYSAEVDYLEDTLAHFRHFNLPEPRLIRAYSTDPDALAVIAAGAWDCMYIDGNHDYDVVRADWTTCSRAVAPGGLIVLDDSGLTTTYKPPAFATGGHPGPSRVAAEIDRSMFQEILQVGHNRVFRRMGA